MWRSGEAQASRVFVLFCIIVHAIICSLNQAANPRPSGRRNTLLQPPLFMELDQQVFTILVLHPNISEVWPVFYLQLPNFTDNYRILPTGTRYRFFSTKNDRIFPTYTFWTGVSCLAHPLPFARPPPPDPVPTPPDPAPHPARPAPSSAASDRWPPAQNDQNLPTQSTKFADSNRILRTKSPNFADSYRILPTESRKFTNRYRILPS